jgi:hypothetical protein
VDANFSVVGLDALLHDLETAGPKVLAGARAVLQKGALNIKNGMREDFTGHRHAPLIPYAVTYDTRITAGGAEAEIGVDKNRPQGALGNLLAFGSSKNAAVVDHTAALRRELPALERYLADVAEKSLG